MAGPEPRDYCVVSSEPLARMVNTFVSRWNQRHPPERPNQFTGRSEQGPAMVRAIDWLAAESGVSAGTIANLARPTPRFRTTELRIADRLLMAMDAPEALSDGTFGPDPIRPNPLAPAADRARCCGGSAGDLNGAA